MGLFSRKDISKLKDEELIQQYKKSGKTELVGELFKRYTHLVLGCCMKYLKNEADARDMVMQIFEKLMVDLKDHEVGYFKGWLFTVSRNACLMELRKRKTKNQHTENYLADVKNDVETGEDQHLDFEDNGVDQIDALEGAIAQLNEAQKTCIELFYLKKHSYAEVADLTGYSLKQVKSYLQNGKRNLRILMTNGNSSG